VVDLILNLTLSDLDPSRADLGNMTITLQCQHTFTVEVLDGVCDLKKAYERDENTNTWIKPLLSSETFVKTPCCPTCRVPISARRYGRVTKRGNLDLLERNVATRMASGLRTIQDDFSRIECARIEEKVANQVTARPDFVISVKAKASAKKRRDQLTSAQNTGNVLPVDFLGLKIRAISGLPKADVDRWTSALQPLLALYKRSAELSSHRFPHSLAYDASFSMLYEGELETALQGLHPPRQQETYALRAAKTKVGMAPPRADTRFQVEAIWASIDIRGVIGNLAEAWFSKLVKEERVSPVHVEAWATFIMFIHDSCSRDAEWAAEIARTTNSHRQELLSGLRNFRTSWRKMQFQVMVKQSTPGGLSSIEKRLLARSAEERLLHTKEAAQEFTARCASSGNIRAQVILEEFKIPLEKSFRYWQELIDTLRGHAVFYQPVTDEERIQVVSSFAEYSKYFLICYHGELTPSHQLIADIGTRVQMVTSSRSQIVAEH